MQNSLASLLICLGSTLLFLAGCEAVAPFVGPDITRVENYTKRVEYHRGPCYGRCPVYTLSLYDNGLLVYQGERFTDKEGTWQRTIDRRQASALLDSFARADFENYPRTFRSQIADVSSMDLTYIDADGTSYVTSYADYAPPEVITLDQRMQQLANLPNYRPVSDTIPGLFTSKTSVVLPREEVIVQLRPGVNPETWIIKYGKQNVELKNRISPSGDYYLLSIDTNVMPTQDMLDFIRQDQQVLSAQLNRPVQPR